MGTKGYQLLKEDWKWQRGSTSHFVWKQLEKTTCHSEGGNLKNTRAGASPTKASGTMWPPTALLGVSGKWGACGWALVQLDQDEEMGRCMGCTDRQMQSLRFSVRAVLTAFLSLLRKAFSPTMVHVDNKWKFSRLGSMLYISDDNEAVIINGRSLTMRHVSRTHRVALDWVTGLIWTPRSKSFILTPNINSQTF